MSDEPDLTTMNNAELAARALMLYGQVHPTMKSLHAGMEIQDLDAVETALRRLANIERKMQAIKKEVARRTSMS